MQRLGKYEIVRELGQGGMGSVYEAFDPSLDRRVAIKTIRLASAQDAALVRERFAREARVTALLRHPNITAVYEFGEAEDLAFMVMEYLSGRTLGAHLNDTPPAQWPDFLPVLLPCAEVLDYAHAKGVVHLDIKPDNIMVTEDGSPKILDFGLARLAFHTRVTQAGYLVGTLSYLPPESFLGNPTGPAADQFSLAVIVYRLLTGEFPFSAPSVSEMMHRTLTARQAPVADLNQQVPQRASRAIDRALSKDPTHRFGTCVEFLNEVLPPFPLISRPAALALLEAARPAEAAGAMIRTPEAARPPRRSRPSVFATLKSLLWGARDVPAAPSPVKPVSARAGEFTRVFQAAPQAPASPSIAPKPGAFTQVFQAPPGEATQTWQAPTSPSIAPKPGAFTRLFQVPFPPAPLGQTNPSLAPKTGEFTQVFQRPADPRIAPQALAARQAEELIQLGRAQRFPEVVALEGKWLPGVDAADPLLLAFREAARYLLAAQNAGSHSAVEHLTRADAFLATAGNQIRESRTPLAAELPRALKVWKEMTENQLDEARRKAASQLPNPFRAGQPLRPDQGRALFRGRDNVVRQIEAILMEADQSGSIALLGPRRCGKTSLLQMLPTLIPDCLCVFFCLQDNPVESPQAFFEALYRHARDQARRDRRIDIPELKPGGFSAAMEWLQALDGMTHNVRVLLCLDEFERLEDLFPGDHQDVLRLMGLFRATIQHRRNLRLMVSGVAPFDELGQIWNDHFINVRQIRVGHLDRDTAIDLLVHPVPDFPENAIGPAIAAEVYSRTGGQPYLLQLYGSLLIAQLNLAGVRQATLHDIPAVEEEAQSQGAYYLRHCYESAPDPARRVLEELACGRRPLVEAPVNRWLARRGLVDDHGSLAIPVLGSFMKEELGLQ